MLNVAMLSKWHVHAAGYARELMAMDDVNVTCIWDEDAERGAAWAKELGVAFEADLDELLRRPDVDAVAVNCPTAMHPEVIIKAARDLTELMENAYIADGTGHEVFFKK